MLIKNLDFIPLALFIVFLFACKNEVPQASESETTTTSDDKFDDFIAFYERFHADSLFQIEHILFPLDGQPSMLGEEEVSTDFKWQRKDWKIQRPLDEDGAFSQKFTPIDEALIIEHIVHQSGKYAMERRFAKLGDDWKLIYYTDLNAIRQ